MQRLSFATGVRFMEGGRIHRIGERTAVDGQVGWFVTCLETAETDVRRLADLQQAYASGNLVGHNEENTDESSESRGHSRRGYDDLTGADQSRAKARMKFIKYVERKLPPAARAILITDAGTGKVRTAFQVVLEDAAKYVGFEKTPSESTYYRWCETRRNKGSVGLAGEYSNCGNRRQIEPIVKRLVLDTFTIALDEAVAATKAGRYVRLRMESLIRKVDEAIDRANALVADTKLIRPSRSTLYDWWDSNMPAFKKDVVKYGPEKARHMYRFTKGHERPLNALDEAEFDEHVTRIFVLDATDVPLGRLTLCWGLDIACHSLLGVDLSFEPPGDMSLMSTFKNAIMPKSYLASDFPSLGGKWLQYGIPRLIRVDRSRQALGKTAEDLCHRLDIDFDWCDAHTPYFKPYVEGMFRILNEMLLEEFNGYVLPANLRRPDYDPAANGVIRLRELVYLLHAFIIYYNDKPQQSLGGLSPNAMWLRSVTKVPPELPDRSEDIGRLFSILREGRRLGHNGIRFEGLPYAGDALQNIRLWRGCETEVDVRVDPANIANAWARAHRRGEWFKIVSLKPEYTTGRPLHQHIIIRKYEREHFGTDCVRLFDAEGQLRALVGSALVDRPSVRLNKLQARFDGIGMGGMLGDSANLGELWQASMQVPIDQATMPAQARNQPAGCQVLPKPAPLERTTTESEQPAEAVPRPKRPRQAFAGDRSLGPNR